MIFLYFILPGVITFYPFKHTLLQPWYSRIILSIVIPYLAFFGLMYGFVYPTVRACIRKTPMIYDGIGAYPIDGMWIAFLFPVAIYAIIRPLHYDAKALLFPPPSE